jgi:hypothetical protein
MGKSIAQRSRRSQGELGLMAESSLVNTVASVRELREWGKSSHRVHRGGNWGCMAESFLVKTVASVRELREQGKS